MERKCGWKVPFDRSQRTEEYPPTISLPLSFSFSAKTLGIRLVLYSRNELRDAEQEWIAVSATGVANSRGKLFRSFSPRNRNDMPARRGIGEREEEGKRLGKRDAEKKPRGSLIASEMHSTWSEQ